MAAFGVVFGTRPDVATHCPILGVRWRMEHEEHLQMSNYGRHRGVEETQRTVEEYESLCFFEVYLIIAVLVY